MRSKIYKKILFVIPVVLVAFLLLAYFIGLQSKTYSIKLQESSQNPATQHKIEQLPNSQDLNGFEKTNSSGIFSEENEVDEKIIEVSLKVQDKTYIQKIKEKSSAYELMNQLKNQGLTFTANEYSDLGFFITEINGVKEDRKSKNYWTLYLNNKEATVGVSKLILKAGDSIEWKLENRSK